MDSSGPAEHLAIFGNDLATLPSYPADPPPGSIAGVSSFQVHIADSDILTARATTPTSSWR